MEGREERERTIYEETVATIPPTPIEARLPASISKSPVQDKNYDFGVFQIRLDKMAMLCLPPLV